MPLTTPSKELNPMQSIEEMEDTVLLTPSILYERQNLVEEVEKLSAEKEVDRQYLEFMAEKISSLNKQLTKSEYQKGVFEGQSQLLSQELSSVQDSLCELRRKVSDLTSQNERLVNESTVLRSNFEELSNKYSKVQKDLELMLTVSEVLKREKSTLKESVSALGASFSFAATCNDDNISHYTGITNINTFYWLLSMVPENLKYYMGSNVVCLSRENQLFLTLLKLRRNVSHEMLSDLFKVSLFTVSNVFITWVNALHLVIVKGLMKTVPSLRKVQKSMPSAFAKYPNCRMIIDCTEVEVEIPGRMGHHNQVYSNYKSRCTFKGLVGIAPNGTVVFTSKHFPGSTSDKKVVEQSRLLEVFEPGDAIMADKGFLIKDILPNGVGLNLPPFKDTPQFTQSQITETLEIARSRIHVERAIQRIKLFTILNFIPHSTFQFASQIFQVCASLCNFGKPLIKEVEDIMRS